MHAKTLVTSVTCGIRGRRFYLALLPVVFRSPLKPALGARSKPQECRLGRRSQTHESRAGRDRQDAHFGASIGAARLEGSPSDLHSATGRFAQRARAPLHKPNAWPHACRHDTVSPIFPMYALDPTGRCRAARSGTGEGGRTGRGRPDLRAGLRAAGGGTGRGREEGEAAVGGAASGAGAAGSEGDAGNKFCDMFQRCAAAIPLPVEPVTEEVASYPVVDPGGEHPVLEGMAQGIHRVARRLEQAIGAEKLVHDRAQGRAVPVAGKALGVLLESLQRDARQRDHAARVMRLELPPLGLDGNMRHVAIDTDRVRSQRCAFGGPVARVDHPEQQSAGLTVQPVQRAWGEQARPDPALAEWRARQLLALLEGQLAQG